MARRSLRGKAIYNHYFDYDHEDNANDSSNEKDELDDIFNSIHVGVI